eukprot:3551117-Prymnesium_polylepis.1
MEEEEAKYDAHLAEDIAMRRQVNGLVDAGKALREHNLRTGVYEAASKEYDDADFDDMPKMEEFDSDYDE